MSIFDKLFGRGPSKIDLIRSLLKARLSIDPTAGLAGVTPDVLDSEPDHLLLGTPEGTIAAIVEAYTVMKRRGTPDDQILHTIEQHRSMIGAGIMPSPLTLRSYIRYRVSFEHSDSAPISDDSLDHSIRESQKFFESV